MKSGKNIAIIFNIVIALICVAAIAGYFIMPLWRMNIDITFTEEFTDYIIDSANISSEDGDVENTVRTILTDASISIPFEMRTTDAFDALFKKDTSAIESMIEHNVDLILEELSANIDQAVKSALSAAVNDAVNSLALSLAEDEDAAEVMQKLEEAGIDNDYITQKTSEIYDALNVDNATVDDVLEIVDSTFDELATSIAAALDYEGDVEELTEEFRAYIADILNALADENGNIAIGEVINDLIAAIVNGEDISEVLPKAETNVKLYPVYSATFAGAGNGVVYKAAADNADGGEQSGSATSDALKQQIKDYIMNNIGDETLDTIRKVMSGIAILLMFTFFTWAYLILKMIFKSASRNPAIKIGLPIWLGWLPFLIFALIPATVFTVIINGVEIEGLPEFPFNIAEVLRMQFMSAGVVSFFAAAALIVISFVYWPLRRKLKKNAV